MNSPVQNNSGAVGRQFLAPVSSKPQSEAGRLSGQEVKKSGFSWGTAGRILAGVATLGLSEAGYAIYKACTRPATDNDRPMGGAKAYLKEDRGPAAKMLSDRPRTAAMSSAQDMPVGSLSQTFEVQHRERMDRLLGPDANYDLDEVNSLNENVPATQDKAALAKLDLIESWNSTENKFSLNVDGWETKLPGPFAKDAIERGNVRVENGKLVAVLQGEEFNGAEDHKLEKMALVDAFTSITLATGDASDDTKGIFKQNLFSFTHQGAAAMFLNVIIDQTGLSPLDPKGSFNFTFSAQDGKNVIVEQRYNADKIQGFRTAKGAPEIEEVGPLTSKIIFSIPIDQLKRPDFNPSCLTVISADWVLNS